MGRGAVCGATDPLLDRPYRQRRTGKHLGPPTIDPWGELAPRPSLVDDAAARRLARSNSPPGEQKPHRQPMGDLALQQNHAAVERHPTDARLRQAETRVVGRNHDVATEHHLEAAAERVAVDTGTER